MSKSGPIVVVEDDADDRIFLEKIFTDLETENPRLYFDTGDAVMDYLLTTSKSTYFILSDINLPGQNGLDFKRQVDDDPILRKKSIPFIFYSSSARQEHIDTAYSEMTVQGFFKKEDSYQQARAMIATILHYWSLCRHPNM